MKKPNMFFDYGGFLFNYDFDRQTLFRAHDIALRHLNSEGLNFNLDQLSKAHNEAINTYLEARRDFTEWPMDKIMTLMLGNLGIHSADLTSQMSEIYKLNDHDSTPKGNSLKILNDLALTKKLGIISNLPHDSLIYELERYGMKGLFDTITISYEVGVRKPHPRIYTEAMKRANVKPGDCLFVSHDDEEVNGARAVGMEAVLADSLEEMIGVL